MHRAPSPTRHRTARLTAWLKLWLVWFVGVCAVWWTGGGRAHPRDLDRVAHVVRDIIICNVAERFRPPPKSRHRHGRLKSCVERTIAGSYLRRALRGGDAPSRLFAILAVLRDLDAHVARLLRRLARGLTRLRIIFPARGADTLHDAPPHAVACADTS